MYDRSWTVIDDTIGRQINRHERRLHPLPVRVMHWINAIAIFIMIGSGWKIYNDDVILGWLHFPDAIVIGKWRNTACSGISSACGFSSSTGSLI